MTVRSFQSDIYIIVSPAGDQWCPAPPFKIYDPISCFTPRLLHTSNIVLKNVPPRPCGLRLLLRNAGDGSEFHRLSFYSLIIYEQPLAA